MCSMGDRYYIIFLTNDLLIGSFPQILTSGLLFSNVLVLTYWNHKHVESCLLLILDQCSLDIYSIHFMWSFSEANWSTAISMGWGGRWGSGRGRWGWVTGCRIKWIVGREVKVGYEILNSAIQNITILHICTAENKHILFD